MSKAKKIRAGKYVYGGCVIEKSKLEQMWYATNSPKGILILKRTIAECKAAIDSISA